MTIGSVYYMIPRLFGKNEMYSTKLVEAHFWIATIGVVLYIASMWIAGVLQGMMWGSLNADGTLTYSFVESVKRTMPFYMIRFTGGLLYLSGMCIMHTTFTVRPSVAKRLMPRFPRCLKPSTTKNIRKGYQNEITTIS